MKRPRFALFTAIAVLAPLPCHGVAKVEIARGGDDAHFKSQAIPPPALDDAATDATFTVISGQRSSNGADLAVLHDGKMPASSDAPRSNFFFQDARKMDPGGQHLVSITSPRGGNLGDFRHLLFEFEPTDSANTQSNTFLSEIDVIDADQPAPQPVAEPLIRTYPGPDGKHTYVLDATLAPDLVNWVEQALLPVVYEWYPKMSAMLPSDGYTAPKTVMMEFRDDMGDTPAYAVGNKLSMSVPWFRSQLQGEATGGVIHELVHIIQNYWRAATTHPNPTRTPGWITEGIPDYFRWFIYEPEKNAAQITRGNVATARYDSSYRISANFLNWVIQNHDPEIICKLNAAAREGRYSDQLWQDATAKSLEELGDAWKMESAERLGL